MTQMYPRRGFGCEALSDWTIFGNFLDKKAILMPLDHILHVFRAFERTRFLTYESQLTN